MTRVLVTGVSGFIGFALANALSHAGLIVRAASRRTRADAAGASEHVLVGALGAAMRWEQALAGVDAVVHLAGPAHGQFSTAVLQHQIVGATEALAAQAEAAGVRRFVYMSSIKATRARTVAGPVREDEPPRPEDDYGRAKLAAERAVCAFPSLHPVVLRPPLVVAAHAKANFAKLLALARSGLPLPFAGIANRRSLISLQSCVAAIAAVLERADAPAGVYHIADHPALSAPEMVAALREGMGLPPRVFRGPKAMLTPALTESLEIDDRRFRAAYGEAWSRDARATLVGCGAAFKVRQA